MFRCFISKWSHFTQSPGAEVLSAQLRGFQISPQCVSNGGPLYPNMCKELFRSYRKPLPSSQGRKGGTEKVGKGKGDKLIMMLMFKENSGPGICC